MAIVKHLIADDFGTHIGKYSQQLKITQKGKTLTRAPLLHLESVSITSQGVSISADALAACSERGIPVFFLDGMGTPFASLYAAGLTGTILTRREQLRAYDDRRGLHIGLAFAAGKVQNQADTLKYLAKNRKDSPEGQELVFAATEVLDHLALLERLDNHDTISTVRAQMMGIEGNAARRYWQAIRPILPGDYGWSARTGRGAKDPINSLLNYGYGILYGQVERALVLSGLDPYAGFVHADRPGKPSLVLDLIEEFRQVAVDRVVFGLANRRYKVEQDEQGRLLPEGRRAFAEHILQHMEATVRYQGQRFALGQVIQTQARELAAYLCRRRDAYIPYKAGW